LHDVACKVPNFVFQAATSELQLRKTFSRVIRCRSNSKSNFTFDDPLLLLCMSDNPDTGPVVQLWLDSKSLSWVTTGNMHLARMNVIGSRAYLYGVCGEVIERRRDGEDHVHIPLAVEAQHERLGSWQKPRGR